MTTILNILLVIVCIAMIVTVLMLQGQSSGASGSLTGGAEQLFGKTKARGLELFLQRTMVVLSVVFFAVTITLAYFS